jgi:SAM domain (Sterile alpha motif)
VGRLFFGGADPGKIAMDVAGWLRRLGLEKYEPKFHDNRIGVDDLPSLTAEDLKDLGINLVGDRRRLLGASVAIV